MKCVICEDNEADKGWHRSNILPYNPITCKECRHKHYPSFMNSNQYKRYWDAFHKKWRKENKVRNM